MTKISIYSVDNNVTGNDKWIGSDSQNFNATKNFTPNKLANYFNHNQVVDTGNELRYTYQTLDPLEARARGTLSFITEIGPQVNFSAITTFLLSKYTLKQNDVSDYLDFLNGSQVIISKASDTNLFALYKITNVSVYLPEPNFFNVDVTFVDGNGFIYEDQDYIISLALDKYNQPITNTSQLINDGSDGIHPFITAQDLPAQITLTTTGTSGVATLIGSILNIPDYSVGSLPTLNQVLTTGNTSQLDANIGKLGIWDPINSAYAQISSDDNIFSIKDSSTNSLFAINQGSFVVNKNNSINAKISTVHLTSSRTFYFPDATGTIALTSNIPTVTPSALTKTDDTNVTLTLGGSPSTALLQGVSLTLGWTGTLADSRIASAATWNAKQNALSGTGLVKSTAGTISYVNGTIAQYVRGDGSLATFPTIPTVGTWGALNYPTWTSGTPFVKMTAAGTFALDTNTYLTSAVTSVSASGLLTSTGGNTPTISTQMHTDRLVGRTTAGTGTMEEITVGSGLTLSGGTLSATATGGGIPHTTASGTDTYTATVTSVTSYADGDAYLVRFTNGNTTACTLNINGLGAIALYRNNDGALIGGDIWSGAEMLCVYNSTTTSFQCIGTSSNSLFAYVTNADSVSITKGQPVYAFGGQGDRLTVKRAFNTSDATSAKTVGVVLTSSIAVNQKGIIIIQGLLDGLSILPTSTWADGDPVYLGTTAGSITNVKQYAPNHLVYLGTVTTASNGSAGRWYVRVQNGYELDELHNVQAQSPSLKDTLWYDSGVTPGQWKTGSISSILGYTPLSSANNGLSLSGTIAQLGGTLLQSTTIDGGSSSAYNLTFTNGDLIVSNGSGIGGARGNIILSNNRSIYWGNSSGNYIGANSSTGGFTYYAPPSTGKHIFYSSMNFANYGSGTKTGTATYNLSVTSTGNIIETAIPPAIPSLTAGSVLFSNGTTLAQDNANFFWDDTNNRLGIGTSTPYTSLTVQDSSSTQILLRSTTGIEGIESFAGGTLAKFDITTGGTYQYGPLTMLPSVGFITYAGYEVLTGNITTGYIPRKSPIGVVDSLIYDDGTNVGIGTTTPATALDVNGVITATGGDSTSWNAKQDALVSGTNIKTINSNSVLGSGDISVQDTLVSGTNIKTINGSSVLGSGDLTVSASVGRHAIIPLASGNVTNSVTIPVNPLSNTAFTANRLVAYPFIPSQNFTSSNLFINVSTLALSSFCRIAVYDDLNGYPNNRLFVSSDLDCSTTGQKTASASVSFVAGTIYWLAFHGGAVASSTSCILPAQSIPLKANTIGSMANCVFYNLNFTTPTPTTFLAGQSFQNTNLQYIGITKA